MTDTKPPAKSTLQKAEERLVSIASSLTHSASSTASSLTNSASSTAAVITGTSGSTISFPAFDDLPKIPGQPQGCMWGFWDQGAKKDELGSLNNLTRMVVKQASSEIKTGEHVQLDWSLDNVQFPSFGRKEFGHNVIGFKGDDGKGDGPWVLDDEIHINTQSGSQWDSLKHFAHQGSGMFYNGLTYDEALHSTRNGTHNWCERGGIVGRGVLVDWVRWYEQTKGTPPSPITRHEIPIEEIQEALAYQNTTTRPGDIFIVRSGYVRWHNFANTDARKAASTDPQTIGIAGNEQSVRWFYDQHFSAVAGDTVAFEAWPPTLSQPAANGAEAEKTWCLHEWLLTQWGTPIGEMWDLESLARACEREGRWSFLLTSAPLHVKGGVGSPPCAIAIL